jgi:hypothetical protein
MTAEELSKIIAESINSEKLFKLKNEKSGVVKDVISVILKLCTKNYVGAGESAIQTIKDIIDYKESEFFRKYYVFLYELATTTQEQRHQFAEEIQEKAEDFSGNVIMNIVDRMDNIHKESVLAKLSIARMYGWITIEDFFRLSSMLERIPYVDLAYLAKYKNDFYDESGDTELLYSSGALVQTVIDPNEGNKYRLSVLGQKLLLFGFGVNIEVNNPPGTIIQVDSLNRVEVNRMIEEDRKKHQPRFEGSTLVFD